MTSPLVEKKRWMHWLRLILLGFWIATIVGVYGFLHAHHITLRILFRTLRLEVLHAGPWGPLFVIGMYVVSSVLLIFPKAGVDIISGAVYGPVLGSLFVLVGLNLSAAITFYLGRFFGLHLVQEHERGWVKKYDDLLVEEGFVTVFLMRLFFFPFDPVNIGCGMSKMRFRPYLLATFLGSLPGTVTFVVLGQAFTNQRSWALFGALLVITLLLFFVLRRSSWVKKKLLEESEKGHG